MYSVAILTSDCGLFPHAPATRSMEEGFLHNTRQKVVAAVWGAEVIPFLSALAFFH